MSKISEVHPKLSVAMEAAIRALDAAIALRQAEIAKMQQAVAAARLVQAETAIDQVVEEIQQAVVEELRLPTTRRSIEERRPFLRAADSTDSWQPSFAPPDKVANKQE